MRHPLETAVAVAAAVVAVAFGLCTYERWLRGHRRQELAWSVALGQFAVAAGALAAGAQAGWNGPTFRIFYLFGAIADVPVLALGTIYLLGGRQVGDRAAIGVALASTFAAGVVLSAPFGAAIPRDQLVQGSKVFGALPRVLAATGSAGGAIVIVAGAVWSVWRVRRDGAPRRLLWSNGLIALGTLVLGGSGTLNSLFGAMTAFAVSLLAGIVVLFSGFLLATAGSGAPRAIPPARPWHPPPGRGWAADGRTQRRDARAHRTIGCDTSLVTSLPLAEDEELDDGSGENGRQEDGQGNGRSSAHPSSLRALSVSPGSAG